jgi:hypothetical protein
VKGNIRVAIFMELMIAQGSPSRRSNVEKKSSMNGTKLSQKLAEASQAAYKLMIDLKQEQDPNV